MSTCFKNYNYDYDNETESEKQQNSNQCGSSYIQIENPKYYGYGKRKRSSISTITSAGRRRVRRRYGGHNNNTNNNNHNQPPPRIPAVITITIKPQRHNKTTPTVDDYADCGECGNDCLFNQTTSCNCCEGLRCPDCTPMICDICHMRERQGEQLILGSQVCQSCVAAQCVNCPELTVCKRCMGQCCAAAAGPMKEQRQHSALPQQVVNAVREQTVGLVEQQAMLAMQQAWSAQYLVARLEEELREAHKYCCLLTSHHFASRPDLAKSSQGLTSTSKTDNEQYLHLEK